MAMRIRSTMAAICLHGCVCAGALGMLLAAPDVTCAQQLVRLTRGEGVTILPAGRSYRLGETPRDQPNEITLRGNPIIRICCPNLNSSPQPSCITERQVHLNASKADVLGRYGPPRSGSDSNLLRYPGVSFGMDQHGRVVEICVERRL